MWLANHMHAAPHAERSCVKGRPEAVDGVQNPNPRPDPRIFKKIRPNPSAYKILRSVTALVMTSYRIYKMAAIESEIYFRVQV